MALFALGLTKMAVEGVVSTVKSAFEEEAKLKVRVQNDLVFITGEFEMMRSFLNIANKEHTKNEVVTTWVRQVRDLAFDVEDCVELVISLDIKSGSSWLWRVLPGCMAPPRPLDQAIADLQRLKATVEDVSHRNTRYNLLGDFGSNFNSSRPALVTTISTPTPELMLSATADTSASSSTFHSLREVWEATGKMRRNIGSLKRLITDEGSDLEVISLWGSPGSAADLGVTSVLRKAYNDPEIYQEFKSRAWVKLMHPFNPDEFLKSLLTQFYASSHRANVLGAEFKRKMRRAVSRQDDLLKAQLMQQVSDEQKYLVIVEQLSTVAEWDIIRMYLRESTNGSRIVVTMQQLGLVLSCTRSPYQVSELRQFSYGQSLCAFFSKKKGYSDQDRSHNLSRRITEARDWIKNFKMGKYYYRDICKNCVTSVWGIAGVGKSSLVRTVYFTHMDAYIEGGTKYSWVDVPNIFSLTDFSRCLLMGFHSDDLEAKETAAVGMLEGEDPISWCRNFLQENNYFVVIDGLHSMHDWDLIKAAFLCETEPINGNIVVITNKESVARHCVHTEDDVTNVQGLEAEAALNLFMKIASVSELLTSDGTELSRLTVSKCGGLPKVITAIGNDCRGSGKMRLEYINANFMSILETSMRFHSLRGLFSWMKSYFDDCPDKLKPCIFYLSVFPLGHNIRRRRLLRRWIAEGYSGDTSGSTAEENGEELFSKLVELSIIQEQEEQQQHLPSKAKKCQVNGFFREYIISRPMQDNLVFALEGRCILNSQHAGQHLTISRSWDRDKILFKSLELPRLRSLTVFGEWKPFFMSAAGINMRYLRVMDLEDTSGVTDDDMEQVGKLLPRLKFLSVRGCEDITHLPNSLGGLRQLQTLDIKGTCVFMIPPAIMKLEHGFHFQ